MSAFIGLAKARGFRVVGYFFDALVKDALRQREPQRQGEGAGARRAPRMKLPETEAGAMILVQVV